jgi:Predicted membrane protein (DUF2142)
LDAPLHPAVYTALGLLVPITFLGALDLNSAVRLRVALLYLCLTIGYVFIVFAIFYIVWTPLDADRIQGVQGRYFLVLLPVISVATAAVLAGGLSATIRAAVSLGAVILSGLATLETVLRVDWNLW